MEAKDYQKAATADLERWLRNPRGPEDARAIREELNRRRGETIQADKNTMELGLKI